MGDATNIYWHLQNDCCKKCFSIEVPGDVKCLTKEFSCEQQQKNKNEI